MKVTKEQLKEMVRDAVKEQLSEAATRDRRLMKLERFRLEVSLTTLELLEDVIETLDDEMWRTVVEGLKHKYGYKI